MTIRPCRILVCFAVKEEAAPFRRVQRDDIEVVVTGMGPGLAGAAIRQAFQRVAPGLVLTCGFAGALAPELRTATVVFDADAEFPLVPQLKAAGAVPGAFACVTRVATLAAEKRNLRETTGATAVEMESGIIREACRRHGVPAATVRVISDEADEDLPLDFNTLMTSQGTVSLPLLVRRIAGAPWVIPGLVRLGRRTARAAGELARVLDAICAEPPSGGARTG